MINFTEFCHYYGEDTAKKLLYSIIFQFRKGNFKTKELSISKSDTFFNFHSHHFFVSGNIVFKNKIFNFSFAYRINDNIHVNQWELDLEKSNLLSLKQKINSF